MKEMCGKVDRRARDDVQRIMNEETMEWIGGKFCRKCCGKIKINI